MTPGLLISRKQKIKLCLQATKDRTPESIANYKRYRNIFNTLLRKSKKMYFNSNFEKFKKNPRRTWDLLKEAANIKKSSDKVEKIVINNDIITDQRLIANHFNDYFSKIGVEIAQTVTETLTKPETLCLNF